MDWPFLLPVGSLLCQEQHSHHCLCLWASAYYLVLLLLWPPATSVYVPRQVQPQQKATDHGFLLHDWVFNGLLPSLSLQLVCTTVSVICQMLGSLSSCMESPACTSQLLWYVLYTFGRTSPQVLDLFSFLGVTVNKRIDSTHDYSKWTENSAW